jgi:hypothetical protein
MVTAGGANFTEHKSGEEKLSVTLTPADLTRYDAPDLETLPAKFHHAPDLDQVSTIKTNPTRIAKQITH